MADSDAVVVPLKDVHIVTRDIYPGRGGSQTLHRVEVFGKTLIYKVYRQEFEVRSSPLRRLIEWRADLDVNDRNYLDVRSAFPKHVVVASGEVIGICMPEAPDRFTWSPPRSFRHAAGGTQRNSVPTRRGRPLDYLVWPRDHADKIQHMYYEPPHKLAILGDLLDFVLWLHKFGVVVGDLNPQNVLINTDVVRPGFILLDCDSMWLNGESATSRREPPGLECPFEPQDVFTTRSDLYKFALIAARCLQEDTTGGPVNEELLASFMPSDQVKNLLALTCEGPGPSAARLQGTARAWSRRMFPDGRMFVSTDTITHALWEPRIEPSSSTDSSAQALDDEFGSQVVGDDIESVVVSDDLAVVLEPSRKKWTALRICALVLLVALLAGIVGIAFALKW
jgi:hypothetical protein